MKRYVSVIFVLVLIIANILNLSLYSFSYSSDIKFENYDMNSGLSAMTVTSIIQDSEGYLWLGTSNGLNKFDGTKFITYRHDRDDHQTLSSNGINVVFEDSNNNLWIGTNTAGLNKFDKNTGKAVRYQHNPNNPER